ncbi:uncharacterized protein LOC135497006 [Lineus longissimus]|uniref:uncharacterized protein LOC135497006 n=1 Tax=Lineus longissimus TaxID=88925 RepID=UPI00315C55A0
MPGTNIIRGFLLSLLLALSHAGLDFRQEPFCFWSVHLKLSNIKADQGNGSSVTVMIDQLLHLRTKHELNLNAPDLQSLGEQRSQFEARDGTVWEDLGRNRGLHTFEEKKPNRVVKEAHVLTSVPLRFYLLATTPAKMVRDASVEACRTKFLWNLVYIPLQVSGCKLESISINFAKSDNSHIRDIIHLDGTETRMTSKQGENREFKIEFEMELLSDNISQCSLVRNGDYCQGVLNGETKFQYVNINFVKKALMYSASILTCFALYSIMQQKFRGSKKPTGESILTTILLESVYGGIFFVVIVFIFLPVHDHATYLSCKILWQPSLLSGFTSMVYYVYRPFVIISPLLFASGYAALKAGYIKHGKLLEHLITIQCTSAVFQIWFGLYGFVMYRDIGQCFHIIMVLTIIQTLLSYFLGSNAVEDEDDDRPHED